MPPSFPPTLWSLVHELARNNFKSECEEGWRRLLHRYRAPITETLRLQAKKRDLRVDPGDLCDGFFSYLFEHDLLSKVSRDQGLFRCFIQGVARNYVRGLSRKQRAEVSYPLDSLEPLTHDTDADFVQQEENAWALGLVYQGLERLDLRHAEQAEVFRRHYGIGLEGETQKPSEIASELGISNNAVSGPWTRSWSGLASDTGSRVRRETTRPGAPGAEEPPP